MHTATVENVHTTDVRRVHLVCPTNGHVGIRDGKDGGLTVL